MRLIYFSPVRASSYAQRSHFMVETCLAMGIEEVLWVNPYPGRLPSWNDFRKLWGTCASSAVLDQRVRVLNVPALPIEPLPGGPQLNALLWGSVWEQLESFATAGPTMLGIGRPCALADAALRRLRPAVSFYDAMDNFPEFHRGLSRRAVRRHEDQIAAVVDVVLASSTFLTKKFSRRKLRVEKLLNACAPQPLVGYRTDSVPADGRSDRRGPIVLGYVGCLARWFDWGLVRRLAAALPDARIELVGPCEVPPPSPLSRNIRILPACRHDELPWHLKRFSAGLIPFVCNRLTAGVDPIKYYDYRAAGLPVLSTRFGEMAHRGRHDSVYFLDEGCDLAAAVFAALRHPTDAAALHRFRSDHNWSQRISGAQFFRQILPRRVRLAA